MKTTVPAVPETMYKNPCQIRDPEDACEHCTIAILWPRVEGLDTALGCRGGFFSQPDVEFDDLAITDHDGHRCDRCILHGQPCRPMPHILQRLSVKLHRAAASGQTVSTALLLSLYIRDEF